MKKFLKVFFVVTVATVASYNVYQSQSVKDSMSELALANVEALANGSETGDVINCCESCNGDFCGTFYPASDPTRRIEMYYK